MSTISDTRSSLKPIYEAKPDMRFATTFISNKYRDYAVRGEVIMDKVTGEIFNRRNEDGRVVSFFQNKKYLHDLMLELRVLLNNNANYTYPDEDDVDAYYLSTDYDVMSLNEERDIDISNKDIVINNESTSSVKHINFKISKKTNGFFVRLTTRDSDRAIVEWVTNQYNSLLKNYSGTVASFITESQKFTTIEKWEDSNAVVDYTLTITTNGTPVKYNFTDYVRVNEESCITFPASIGKDTLLSADSIDIQINQITFAKLRFMLKYRAALPTEFTDGYNKFIYPDKAIYIRYINICTFVDQSTDINLLGNEFIVALVDVPYCYRYMMKMNNLLDDSSFITSPNRPHSDIWKANGIWAEQVRDVFKGGYEVNLECEVDLKQLEDFLAENDDTDYVQLTTDVADTENMYGKQV